MLVIRSYAWKHAHHEWLHSVWVINHLMWKICRRMVESEKFLHCLTHAVLIRLGYATNENSEMIWLRGRWVEIRKPFFCNTFIFLQNIFWIRTIYSVSVLIPNFYLSSMILLCILMFDINFTDIDTNYNLICHFKESSWDKNLIRLLNFYHIALVPLYFDTLTISLLR
jgi:hypothetical protein